MIRGDRLLLLFHLMWHCARGSRGNDNGFYERPSLSLARIQVVLRDRFGDDDGEAMYCHLVNWHGLDRYFSRFLFENPALMELELDARAIAEVSTYGDGSEPSGLRPLIELIASGELTEANFKE